MFAQEFAKASACLRCDARERSPHCTAVARTAAHVAAAVAAAGLAVVVVVIDFAKFVERTSDRVVEHNNVQNVQTLVAESNIPKKKTVVIVIIAYQRQ